ncbi:MAG: insulinase family protein [Lachnospiraceae bacterium]|nr:insulinase family protein [Lachnospiraceae bacterium]
MKVQDVTAYELIEQRKIEDLNCEAYLLRHKKTGARLALLSNDDENKVFSIGFRTPPTNSTGVAHILEHSVLCGSKNFPVKDPFVELVKGSLNTFLNAMTYPDKTIYPVASCNDVDFQNLMHVYLDAVFYPNIYAQKKIFLQEGWHYEMESEDADLTINGVVYNEMKGALSSPEDVLNEEIGATLFPESIYGVNSGGDPEFIPELSYEQFLEFHKKYYHPSNSYIYLYGNMDMAEKLEYIDREYLSNFGDDKVDSSIALQTPFTEAKEVVKEYPINPEDKEETSAYLAYCMTAGDELDQDLYVALQVLDYAIGTTPGAPIKKALIDKGIGQDIVSYYSNGILQPYFMVAAQNTSVDRKQEFVDTIDEVLANLVKEGIDKKALLAGINHFEFRYREADFGRAPKGLLYGIQMLDSWLYDDAHPFMHIECNATYARLRKMVDEGGFEALIQKYLIDNPHKAVVVLKPKKGLQEEREAALKEKLAAMKAQMSKEEIAAIVEETKALKKWQETPDRPEDLATLPMLSRADMKKEAAKFVNEEREIDGTKVLFHNLFTNEIGYLRFMFDASKVPARLFPRLKLLSTVIKMMDTKSYNYKDLFNESNIVTGGLNVDTTMYGSVVDSSYKFMTEVRTKVLYSNMAEAMELVKEILFTTNFADTKRLQEVLTETKAGIQSQMSYDGASVASMKALSYVSPKAAATEVMSGVAFYRMLEDMVEHFEEHKEQLVKDLQELSHILFRPENLMVDFIGDEKGYELLPELVKDLKKDLYTVDVEEGTYVPEVVKANEGFKTAGQVQYVCRGGSFKDKGLEYTGALKVLKVMMGYDYLWSNIRVKGGAYGCWASFGRTGESFMTSYRDPHLKETIDIYEAAADYVENFEADERALTQFIIGAIGELDTPLTPSTKGSVSLGAYMSGLTDEDVQKERDEVLSIDADTFHGLGRYIRAFLSDEALCVVGSAKAVEDNKTLFGKVENLV